MGATDGRRVWGNCVTRATETRRLTKQLFSAAMGAAWLARSALRNVGSTD